MISGSEGLIGKTMGDSVNEPTHHLFIAYIGTRVAVSIDRPRNTRHPQHCNLLYELDYGFVPNTNSKDGEELDAYVLGRSGDDLQLYGLCIGVILRPDGDDKLIVAANASAACETPERIRQLTAFQEQFFWPEVYVDPNGRYSFSQEGVIGFK